MNRIGLLMAVITVGAAGLGQSHAFAAGCRNSGILFSYSGSIYMTQEQAVPRVVARGLASPYNLQWAPGCEHYAFIDGGALWVGTIGTAPIRAHIPASVHWVFQWSPNGKFLAVEGERQECRATKKSRIRGDLADTFVMDVNNGSVEEITNNCRTYALGWSDDSKQLLLQTEVMQGLSCDPSDLGPSAPPCAGTNLVIWDRATRLLKTLVAAQALDLKGIGSFDQLIRWEPDKHVIFAPYAISNTGLTEMLVAMDDRTANILWSYRCGGGEYVGKGLIRAATRVYDPVGVGFAWGTVFLDENGKAVGRRDVARRLAGLGGGLEYVVRIKDNPASPPTKINLLSREIGGAWQFEFPESYRIADSVWTPSGLFAVEAYRKQPEAKKLTVRIWVLDPARRRGRRLFEATSQSPDVTSIQMTALGSTTIGGRVVPVIPPLVLGRWSQ